MILHYHQNETAYCAKNGLKVSGKSVKFFTNSVRDRFLKYKHFKQQLSVFAPCIENYLILSLMTNNKVVTKTGRTIVCDCRFNIPIFEIKFLKNSFSEMTEICRYRTTKGILKRNFVNKKQ